MHDSTPVWPGKAGQRSESAACSASERCRQAYAKKGACYGQTAKAAWEEARCPGAIRVSGGTGNPVSLTRDCSLGAGMDRLTRSTARACVHEGLSCLEDRADSMRAVCERASKNCYAVLSRLKATSNALSIPTRWPAIPARERSLRRSCATQRMQQPMLRKGSMKR